MNERIEIKDKDGGRRIRWNREWPLKPEETFEQGKYYGSVEDYDPVLRAHCGLDPAA